MHILEFIERFAFAINKKDITKLTPDTIFWNLEEWSSLAALSLISMIEEEYGVTLHNADVKGVRTIQELFDVVKERVQ